MHIHMGIGLTIFPLSRLLHIFAPCYHVARCDATVRYGSECLTCWIASVISVIFYFIKSKGSRFVVVLSLRRAALVRAASSLLP